jgi:hypothetical protein
MNWREVDVTILPQHEGTEGRVYGGSPSMLHFKDGTRVNAGKSVAGFIDSLLRAHNGEDNMVLAGSRPLCPGCYMVALFNAATTLARENGQSLKELGRTMSVAFAELANGASANSEHIRVILDGD